MKNSGRIARTPAIDGLLLVDKPAGITSHDVVAAARRALRTRRIGHAGTLDPFATGLLVLLVGRATRLLPYVEGEPKTYDAEITFGSETDTDDVTGRTRCTAELPEPAAVDAGVAALTGEIDQVPPEFSAKQVAGVRAYRAARTGEPLELPPARVTVHSWNLLGRSGEMVAARVVCSGGTYIRALARDLGRLAGSAAHLRSLRRIGSGCFDVADASPFDRLQEGAAVLLPLRRAVPSMPAQTLDAAERARVLKGAAIPLRTDGARVALLAEDDALVAIAERHDGMLQPRVVLADA